MRGVIEQIANPKVDGTLAEIQRYTKPPDQQRS